MTEQSTGANGDFEFANRQTRRKAWGFSRIVQSGGKAEPSVMSHK
jgi:hypothetical protein